MRALVIDDSRAIRVILSRLLRELGFEVAEATHGRDALDKLAASGVVELALVDWNMPEMNGLDFVRAARADQGLAGMKIIMVTTEAEIARMTLALESGADEYVMKPFTPDALREKLSLLGFEGGAAAAGAA